MAQMFTFTTFIVKLSRHCVSKYKHYICLHNVHLTRAKCACHRYLWGCWWSMNKQSKSRSIWIFHMIYLQKESFVTPEFIFRIGSQISAAGTLITLLREFGGCWGYLHQTDYNLIFKTWQWPSLWNASAQEPVAWRSPGGLDQVRFE